VGGTFLDIGSHDGIALSNTYFFEQERGWDGICIEPNPTVFEALRKNRSCTTINGAIAEHTGKAVFVKIEGYCEMLSGLKHCLDPRHLERVKKETEQFGGHISEIEVDCFNLNDLLVKQGRTSFDYCNIDVEGAEFEIIKSIDFDAIDIGVLTVENNYDSPEIREYMKRQGFELVQKLGVDDVYRKMESATAIEIGGLFTSSILQSDSGRNEAALQSLLKAKGLWRSSMHSPRSIRLYDICMRLGDCYLKAEQLQEAREQFEEALREDQYSAEACYGLGLCFQYAGLEDAAREMFQAAAALKPEWETAQEKALECSRVTEPAIDH
jgi:FkbM family methyltransferase